MNKKNLVTVVIITLCVASLFLAGCLTAREDKQKVSVSNVSVGSYEQPTPVPTPTPMPGT